MNLGYRLRKLCSKDLKEVIILSRDEGWNQTEKDWAFIINRNQNVCLAIQHEDRIIGTALAINYNNYLVWIGMVLVESGYRGKGIGKFILSNLLDRLKEFKSIMLDATPAGQLVYKNLGFKNEYLIHRMLDKSFSAKKLPVIGETNIKPVQLEDIFDIVKLDENVFGTNRKELIEYLIYSFRNKGWILRKNGRLTGVILGRKGNRFHQIGPVIASSKRDAKALIFKSLKELDGQPVVMDVLEDKKEVVIWLKSIGFAKQRHFFRMYQHENLVIGNTEMQYLISGPEFG